MPEPTAVTPGPRQVRVELPLPPADLLPNKRHEGPYLRKLKREYRGLVRGYIRVALGPPPHPHFTHARMAIEVLWPNGRHWWDADNLIAAFKPGLDAFKDMRILQDDSPRHLRAGEPVYRVDRARRRPALIITITDDEAPPAGVRARPSPPEFGEGAEACPA